MFKDAQYPVIFWKVFNGGKPRFITINIVFIIMNDNETFTVHTCCPSDTAFYLGKHRWQTLKVQRVQKSAKQSVIEIIGNIKHLGMVQHL